ncbi:MAG: acetolactate synthase [Verrucomicrobiae bacterium]|nr:acetolactate synthase [Verrucomicrobiae bacterium]
MADAARQTGKSIRPPLVRQFSVFLENKVGSLLTLTRALEQANVHICGISVVDTTDAGVVRMVVDDPERCREVLHKAAVPFNESNLVVVELPHGPEKLDQVLRELVAAEINIEYTYSLMVRPHDKALLALHCEDGEYARDVLEKAGIAVLGQKDISR